MILLVPDLQKRYRTYKNIKTKVQREVNSGSLVKLKKGVYTDDKSAAPYVFANAILSPSYLSFEIALRFYGFNPIFDNAITSASKGKNKHKEFVNDLGVYSYQDIPQEAFSQGVVYLKEGSYTFLIANKEKALCDSIYKCQTITSTKKLRTFIRDSLGIPEEDFLGLNLSFIFSICPLYKSRSLNTLQMIVGKLLGIPVTKKEKKLVEQKESTQEAWDALAAFRNKYKDR